MQRLHAPAQTPPWQGCHCGRYSGTAAGQRYSSGTAAGQGSVPGQGSTWPARVGPFRILYLYLYHYRHTSKTEIPSYHTSVMFYWTDTKRGQVWDDTALPSTGEKTQLSEALGPYRGWGLSGVQFVSRRPLPSRSRRSPQPRLPVCIGRHIAAHCLQQRHLLWQPRVQPHAAHLHSTAQRVQGAQHAHACPASN